MRTRELNETGEEKATEMQIINTFFAFPMAVHGSPRRDIISFSLS